MEKKRKEKKTAIADGWRRKTEREYGRGREW